MICLNCGGLSANFVEVKLLIESVKPKLALITETHVIREMESDQFNIRGYTQLNCYSSSRHTGGVLIYVHSSVGYSSLINSQKGKNWLLAIEVRKGMKPGRFGVVYHSPSESDSVFLNILEDEWLEEFLDLSKQNILAGDFNMDWSNATDSQNLKLVTEAVGLKQHVNQYTRIARSSQTMIDLVFSNCDINVCVVNDFKISDHETLCLSFPNETDACEETVVKIKCWKNYSRGALLSLLRGKMAAVRSAENIHEQANCLVQVIRQCVGMLVVVKFVKTRKSNKWYTVELMEMKRRRDKRYQHYLEGKCEWTSYKVIRNEYSCALRREKKVFIQRSIEQNKNNTKELWRILKRLIKPEQAPSNCVNFDGTDIREESQIADKFNSYFVDSIEEISSSIEDVAEPSALNGSFTEAELKCFSTITLEKLRSVVLSLETKSGSDEISSRVLKDSFDVVGEFLLEVINSSLASGVMPGSWKESVIVPIEKVPGTTKSTEFRPINMLPIYEKTLELIVKEQMLNYITSNNLLVPEQSGYRRNHSCETALNLILAKWKDELEKKSKVIAVFLDLKRAFETISREKLIKVLAKYGLKEKALEWFSSYLETRSQKTKFNSVISSPLETKFGVPQGSVLGPILFILYINDLKRVLKYCDINLFADDTVIFISSDNAFAAIQKLNCDLCNLSNWLKHKKLKLNVSKTKCMIIANKAVNDHWNDVNISGEVVERVTEIKYLGVLIDDKLSFKQHIDHIVKKIAKKFGVLCRLSKELSQWSLIFLYKALISPHFDFCPSIVYLANEQQMNRLQKLQNKVMRLILKCNRRTPRRVMLETLQWLSVRQRVTFLTLMLVHKIAKGQAPEYLNERIKRGRDIHSHRTRFADEIRTASFSLASSQNSLYYKGIKLYNNLPSEVKNEDNFNVFKRHCLCFVKNNVNL